VDNALKSSKHIADPLITLASPTSSFAGSAEREPANMAELA
jgi:hypothetical protein